jgi:hypothetical protein
MKKYFGAFPFFAPPAQRTLRAGNAPVLSGLRSKEVDYTTPLRLWCIAPVKCAIGGVNGKDGRSPALK